MANDRDQNRDQNRSGTRDRTIGEGMNSPDSTQMPLKASTGEPDWETQTNRGADADQARSGDSLPRGARQNPGGERDA